VCLAHLPTSVATASVKLFAADNRRCPWLALGVSLVSNIPSVPHRRWRIAVLLAIGVLVNYLDRINLSVSREALSDSFGVSLVVFGYLSSAFSWTYALMQMPAGILLDRFGVRRVGRISTLLWSVACFAAALAPGLSWFFAARLLLGVSESPTFPANAKAIGYWFTNSERSLATAVTDAAAKFSTAIGVPFLGLLLLHFGWRWSFAATGFISIFYFLLFYGVYRNPKEDGRLSAQEGRFSPLLSVAQAQGLWSCPGVGRLQLHLLSFAKLATELSFPFSASRLAAVGSLRQPSLVSSHHYRFSHWWMAGRRPH